MKTLAIHITESFVNENKYIIGDMLNGYRKIDAKYWVKLSDMGMSRREHDKFLDALTDAKEIEKHKNAMRYLDHGVEDEKYVVKLSKISKDINVKEHEFRDALYGPITITYDADTKNIIYIMNIWGTITKLKSLERDFPKLYDSSMNEIKKISK